MDTPNDVINPSLLEADLERNDLQGGERHGETVGLTQTRKDYSPKEQALLTPYTIPLKEILQSDKNGGIFCLDDILQINRDVMTDLADLHDKSIVHGDVQACNISINLDDMKASLSSEKSKEQNNESRDSISIVRSSS
eukprot:XP_011664736.1 PREDICTED: uncharacterized protein LOC105438518 [Strongylocentrotus purpuratus]